jgi:hypothetical protein
MEGKTSVLGKAGDEELKERVNIDPRDRARVHGRTIRGVRVPDTNRLVKENDVGTLVPRVMVTGCVLPLIGDTARTKFKQ